MPRAERTAAMSELEHPPVPEGVEDIICKIGKEWCLRESSGWNPLKFVLRDGVQPDSPLANRQFQEVKARCRCAWLDESQRRERENPPEDSNPKMAHPSVIEAWQYAEDWRKWGERK